MNILLLKINRRIRSYKEKLFPSLIKKEYKRFLQDGGDYHLRFNYPLTSKSIVFDVGGFAGDFASDLFARMPCKIFIFEPIANLAKRIETRFASNEMIKIFSFGLSNKTEKKLIGVIGDGEGSSTYRTKDSENKEFISLVDIVEFIEKYKISEIDLLKVNIEGGEYDLLPRLISANKLSSIKYIQVQFHNFEKNSKQKKDQIREDLEKTHICDYCYEFIWENWIRKDLVER